MTNYAWYLGQMFFFAGCNTIFYHVLKKFESEMLQSYKIIKFPGNIKKVKFVKTEVFIEELKGGFQKLQI